MVKVRHLPYQAHCFAFGGFEIQMLSAMDSLRGLPIETSRMDVWSRDSDFDVLHCWGLGLPNLENACWAKRSGKMVVVTALVSYLEKASQKGWFLAKYLTGEERLNMELARLADAVVVLNDMQAEVLNHYYRVKDDRIAVIPNIVQEKFFSGDEASFHAAHPIRDFVLCTGNVCRRKNQLNLAKACALAGLRLVLIGGILHGEEAYGTEVVELFQARPEFLWIKELPKDSDLLASAYHACSLFALASHREQQPISALEAAAAGKPLLLSNQNWAKQAFYKNAVLVAPESVAGIAEGLRRISNRPGSFAVPAEMVGKCREAAVGQAYFALYRSLAQK